MWLKKEIEKYFLVPLKTEDLVALNLIMRAHSILEDHESIFFNTKPDLNTLNLIFLKL